MITAGADKARKSKKSSKENAVKAPNICSMNYFSASEKKMHSVKSIKLDTNNQSDVEFISTYKKEPPMISIQALFLYLDDKKSEDLIEFLDNAKGTDELLYLGILNNGKKGILPAYLSCLLRLIPKIRKEIWIYRTHITSDDLSNIFKASSKLEAIKLTNCQIKTLDKFNPGQKDSPKYSISTLWLDNTLSTDGNCYKLAKTMKKSSLKTSLKEICVRNND